jgi:hypothetical protein
MPELTAPRWSPSASACVPGGAAIAGHVAAAGEHPGVHITVDGVPEAQP